MGGASIPEISHIEWKTVASMALLQSLEQIFSTYPSRPHPDRSGRRAAVLVALVATPDGYRLLLTKRTHLVEHHKGQISFPGGAADECDEFPVGTALRESFEEVGLNPEDVRILGALDEVWTPSGFLITPIIGVIAAMPVLLPNPAEVCEILSIPFEAFFDDSTLRTEVRSFDDVDRTVYFYDIGEEPVWGATALIIHRLVTLIREHERLG